VVDADEEGLSFLCRLRVLERVPLKGSSLEMLASSWRGGWVIHVEASSALLEQVEGLLRQAGCHSRRPARREWPHRPCCRLFFLAISSSAVSLETLRLPSGFCGNTVSKIPRVRSIGTLQVRSLEFGLKELNRVVDQFCYRIAFTLLPSGSK
jgi:hypothetical protein